MSADNSSLPHIDPASETTPRPPRGVVFLAILSTLFGAGCLFFLSLGVWQLERLAWKHDLIERVDNRINAEPVPLLEALQSTSAADLEYRPVVIQGTLIPGKEARVMAVTDAGPGRWLMRALRTDTGTIVILNLGFVPDTWTGPLQEPTGPISLTGLLRVSEPPRGFLRENAPLQDRWYSRDVVQIAEHAGLGKVPPVFVDIDADSARAFGQPWPRGGMTVVRFRNHHLGYALTWFALALLVAGGAWRFALEEVRIRRFWHQHRTESDDASDGKRRSG